MDKCICKLRELRGMHRISACQLLIGDAITQEQKNPASPQRSLTLEALAALLCALEAWRKTI